jgi:hypothetical protein
MFDSVFFITFPPHVVAQRRIIAAIAAKFAHAGIVVTSNIFKKNLVQQ